MDKRKVLLAEIYFRTKLDRRMKNSIGEHSTITGEAMYEEGERNM